MNTWRYVLPLLAAMAASSCSHLPAGFDSCRRIREFEQFSWRPALYQSLPALDVTSLPPQVHAAVATFSRPFGEYEFIVSARVSDPYILLEISGACTDCKRWVV
jgi:hypothetical protein